MECSSGEAAKAVILRGAGIGILMEAHLDEEIHRREVKILRIRDVQDLKINSFVIYRKDKPLSYNVQDFLDLIKKRYGQCSELVTSLVSNQSQA